MRVPAVKTPIEISDLDAAFRQSWPDASDAAIRLAIAHSALETGWWKVCYNFNLGNAKATDHEPHCFFPCGENLGEGYARELLAADPVHVKIVSLTGQIASVEFTPDHWMCRFKAYDSLKDAVSSHLAMMRQVFHKAFDAMATGDPEAFVRALKAGGYFTAPLDPYLVGVKGCLAMIPAPEPIEVVAVNGLPVPLVAVGITVGTVALGWFATRC